VPGAAAEPRPAGPFTALARLALSGALPTVGRADDVLGGYRPVLRALLRDLARAHGVRYAALWLPETGRAARPRWAPAVAWRPRRRAALPAAPPRVDDPDALLTWAGVAATVDVTDGGARHGVLVLADRRRPGPWPAPAALLGEAAVCVGLLLRLARHRAAGAAARCRAEQAAHRADVVRLELSAVQAVERDRLATAVTATPQRQLRAILTHVDALGSALVDGVPEAEAVAATIRAGLHDMIEGFRTVVRGVYPQVLRGGGVASALAEIAASLSAPVAFHGELGRRQSWEIESTLYQAAASAITALSERGGDGPVDVELSRDGDVLTIRARRVAADPERVVAALRDDSRRLAALGGRLTVDPVPDGTATVVAVRLPQRFGAHRPGVDPPAPAPTADRPARRSPARDAPTDDLSTHDDPGDDAAAGAPARRLLRMLADRRETPGPPAGAAPDDGVPVPVPVPVPVRVALARQDRHARVLVLGAPAEQLTRVLCGLPGDAGWTPPGAVDAALTRYGHGPYRRVTLRPAGGAPPWRPVHLPDWSGAAWPDVPTDRDRILVDTPADALRGLHLRCVGKRVDVDLAVRLRRWSEEAHGLPDGVVLALGGPLSAAESEFLTVLRAPGRDGFSPVVVCAVREGAAVSPGSRRWLESVSDAVVDWHPADGGGRAVADALRPRLPAAAGALAVRWALRALLACHAAGRLDDQFAHAVEAVSAGAYQVAELDLSQALQGRRVVLPRGHDEAVRLLGAYGRDARARLGLPADADAEQVRGAAERGVAFWRAQCMTPYLGAEIRGACAVLVRACERLLVDGT
jgi:signal transduction histidine kinase